MSNGVQLDQPETYRQLDTDNMYKLITELPIQMEESWRLAGQVELPHDYQTAANAVVIGMGGSAIGGSILESYAAQTLPIPFSVWRNYGLPGYVNEHSLVFALSFSGNTEETISGLKEAHARGARVVAITGNGQVAHLANEWSIPLVQFTYQSQPRAALGFLFPPLLRLVSRLGYLPDPENDFQEAIRVAKNAESAWGAERGTQDNTAKQLAVACLNRIPVVYGADYLSAVARRWKTQFNENAKNWAFFEEFPELNHNAVVGYEYPQAAANETQIIMLDGKDLPDRIKQRIQVTQHLLTRFGINYQAVEGDGRSKLAQIVSLVALGDYTSYYLALANGVNPTPVETIDYLKQQLAAAPAS